MSVRYTRRFRYGDTGPDVEGVGRALARAGHGIPLVVFARLPIRVRRRWGIRKQRALKQFKRKHGLKADYVYGTGAHQKLSRFFDAKAKHLMTLYPEKPKPEELKWLKLLDAMRKLNANTAGYGYGSGHGSRLDSQDWNDLYDCSSSTSKALHEGGVFPSSYAWVSGDFAQRYGEPGKGKYFTVYANSGHVWIRLHRSRWWRFDTSPHGDPRSPKSGPRLRYLPRPTWGFSARHWPKM